MGKDKRRTIPASSDNSVHPDFDLKEAIRQRRQKMLRATINSINKLTVEDNDSTILVLKSDLESNWSEFMHAFEDQEALLTGVGDIYLNEVTQEFVNMHNMYIKAKIHAADLLALSDAVARENGAQPQNNTTANEIRPSFKMAPMRISPFSGDLADWIEFKATCDMILDSNIQEVQRLQYLKDALFGEARSLVKHILPGPGAFNRAMQLLKDRYNDQRAIINAHLTQFYAIPSIDTPTSESFRSMLNALNSLVAALNCYEIDTKSWDSILTFHITQRFDKTTLTEWENKLDGCRTVPKLKVLLDFLQVRITVRQTTETFTEEHQIEKSVKPNKGHGMYKPGGDHKRSNEKNNDKVKAYFTLKDTYACALCEKNHLPSRCTDILRMSLNDRYAKLKKHKLCENCFYPHSVSECPFKPACKKCDAAHHTLLHSDGKQMYVTTAEIDHATTSLAAGETSNDEDDCLSVISNRYFYHTKENSNDGALLATAIVPVLNDKSSVLLHSLIDGGSTANLITIRACELLNLRFVRLNVPMVGVGNSPVGRVLGWTGVKIGSIHEKDYECSIKAIVVQSIGDSKGVDKCVTQNWKHLHGLPLANPKYYQSQKFDLLLGSAARADFILGKIIRGSRNQPIAEKSMLGWLVSGNTSASESCVAMCRATTFERVDDEISLNDQLKQFWEIEEVSVKKILTPEEQMAENIFAKTIRRANDGKFIVDLPFKLNPAENIGESFSMAMRRYKCLQRRFDKEPKLKEQYDAVLEEYLQLNHMQLVNDRPQFQCFLPHHAVVKESSTTTKVRTVFDASAKTSTGVSLNNCLCVGPVIQSELFDLLISWRKFRYAVSSDIEKMYRMMYVNPEHANWQTILWNRPGTNGILPYKLLTVTFGTSSAPFQATRGVHEIGQRMKEKEPKLAAIIQSSFYVDDFLRSFATIEEARATNQAISDELEKYGFNLRKWKSNDQAALDGIKEVDREQCINFDSTFKTLGIAWQATTDAFLFKSMESKPIEKWTKRRVLSVIAKLFDPLGWLAPCIVKAKLVMQDIWRLPSSVNWDAPLPSHIESQWQATYVDLTTTNPIRIPRWLKLSQSSESVELHAFSDASKLSYACCIYIRVKHEDDTISCNLIAAKTKVAPIRATTIPRLELCGALLASKLVRRCVQSLSIDNASITMWCDSKIVLAWLATHPSKWATFVAHRATEIHDNVDASCWRHIPTKQNPADIASRGSTIAELECTSMWWHGPSFLTSPHEKTPNPIVTLPIESAPEKCKQAKVFHVELPKENYILEKFENLTRLLNFTCMVFRWMNRAKGQKFSKEPISAEEMVRAEMHWIRLTQTQNFGNEINKLKKNRTLPRGSALLNLTPFVDDEGILRMNGRVKNIELLQQKTGIILPSKSRFVMLLIRDAHEQQVNHGGVQMTLRALRNKFWIIHARSQVKKLIGKCITCYRSKKLLINQKMADLPLFRTLPARPFTFTGCDFAGPYQIKLNENRNASTTKGYVALFICLTTKAVHFEVVGDMSTAEYVMALENFIARRGIPSIMYTDNGTNLVGGEKEIQTLHNQFMAQTNALTQLLAAKRIRFKRIPARASHMGGIWERAVGLMKYHLSRVMKNTKLTTRRFDHVLKQIECSLNSRPLWAITPNADDIEVITPSHFFNFEPINTFLVLILATLK